MDLKIKQAHYLTVVGFNNSGAPLGERTDILELAVIARAANDVNLLEMFEGEVPGLETLREMKARRDFPPPPPTEQELESANEPGPIEQPIIVTQPVKNDHNIKTIGKDFKRGK